MVLEQMLGGAMCIEGIWLVVYGSQNQYLRTLWPRGRASGTRDPLAVLSCSPLWTVVQPFLDGSLPLAVAWLFPIYSIWNRVTQP